MSLSMRMMLLLAPAAATSLWDDLAAGCAKPGRTQRAASCSAWMRACGAAVASSMGRSIHESTSAERIQLPDERGFNGRRRQAACFVLTNRQRARRAPCPWPRRSSARQGSFVASAFRCRQAGWYSAVTRRTKACSAS